MFFYTTFEDDDNFSYKSVKSHFTVDSAMSVAYQNVCLGCFQVKPNSQKSVESVVQCKSHLFLVLFVDFNLPLSKICVYRREYMRFAWRFQTLVHSLDLVRIPDGHVA